MDVSLTPNGENEESYLHAKSSSSNRLYSANAKHSDFSDFSSPLQRFVEAKAKIQDIYRRIERCIDKIVLILSGKLRATQYQLFTDPSDVRLLSNLENASTCSSVESSVLAHVESFKAGVSQINGMLSRDHMKVVFFGRTSNGKSTVVNAMLHSKVLPYGMGHTTRCFLQVEGSSSGQKCLVKEGSDDNISLDSIDKMAHAFCSQEMGEDVLFRVLWPKTDSRLLQNEVVLVDSPGIDVTPQFDEWIDKHCLDADVFVLVCNAEATLTNAEKKFFQRVKAKLSRPNVFILNNRWDVCMMESEMVDQLRHQHTKRCMDFLVEELQVCDEVEAKNRIFFVSAREVLCRRLQRKGIASPSLMPVMNGAEERLEEFENFERQFEDGRQACSMTDERVTGLSKEKLCISKSAILTKFDSHVEKGKIICDDIYDTLNNLQKNVKSEKERCVRMYSKKEEIVRESRSRMSEFLLHIKNAANTLGMEVKEQISKEFNDQMIRLDTFVEHYAEKFTVDPCLMNAYKKELINQVDYVMNAELPERCSSRVLRQILTTERKLAGTIADLLPQEAREKAEMIAQTRQAFEFTFTVPCVELLNDFQEDLDFRFSLGISRLLSALSKERFYRMLMQGESRRQITAQADGTTQSSVMFTESPAISSALVKSASVVADGGVGFLLLCTVVKKVVGWPVLITIVVIYELVYLYERLCWNDRAKERAFKNQFCDHLGYKVKLLESTIVETCKHQVAREIKELSSRLTELANEELDTIQLEVEELKREGELLDEVSSVITPMNGCVSQFQIGMRRKRKTSPNCLDGKKIVTPVWLPPGDPYLATCFFGMDDVSYAEPGVREIVDFVEVATESEATTSKGKALSAQAAMLQSFVPVSQASGQTQRVENQPCIDFIENPYYTVLKRYIPANLFGHGGQCNNTCSSAVCSEYFKIKAEPCVYGPSVKIQFRVRVYDGKTISVDEYPYLFSLSINGMAVDVGKFPSLNNQDKLPVVRAKLLDVTRCFYGRDGLPFPVNIVRVNWSSMDKRKFICSIRFVLERTMDALLTQLQARPMFSSKDILESLFNSDDGRANDDDIKLCSAETSLSCPITFTRMNIPCRSVKCRHLDCFDARNLLLSNKEQIEWLCPLCRSRLNFDDLRVDELLTNILKNTVAEILKAEVLPDGSWIPIGDSVDEQRKRRSIKSENASGEDSDERLDIISVGSDEHFGSTYSSSTTSGITEVAADYQRPSEGMVRARMERNASPEIIDLTIDDSSSATSNSENTECNTGEDLFCDEASTAQQIDEAIPQQFERELPRLDTRRQCYPIVFLSRPDRYPQTTMTYRAEPIENIYYAPAGRLNIQQPYALRADIPNASPMTPAYLPTSSSVSNILPVANRDQGAAAPIQPNVHCSYIYRPNVYLPHHLPR
ncbi:hypothetical protein M514_11501 [Trichuris suis]|uniref:Dynamin-type G domain-containing protein n=1 Tax=Trichuris suis TaxID=68888 RepID=A0A085NS62_9BILA|nr:hypothetical protein M514_11501 [Trichuris suis]